MRRLVRVFPLLLLALSLGSLLVAKRAQTTPLWAARTGNLCGQCHFDPNGGGPRNDYGFMFARNRHSLKLHPCNLRARSGGGGLKHRGGRSRR